MLALQMQQTIERGNKQMERRAEDQRISKLCEDVAVLQVQMAENTKVTVQVRDILASFRVVYHVAKWITALGAAVAAVYHGGDWLKHKL